MKLNNPEDPAELAHALERRKSGLHWERLPGLTPRAATIIDVGAGGGVRSFYEAFPTARFVSGTVKPLGGNKVEVAGQLTIKGKTQDVVVPATFTPQGNSGVFDGSFTIRRADFSIGEGSWAKFDIVANDVLIKFRITANSK